MDDPRYIAQRISPELESGGSTTDPPTAMFGLSSNVLCPVCDTPRLRSIEACPRCERRRAAKPPLEFRFGIAALMLLTTLIAVLLGLLVTVPIVAVLLGMLSIPAYIRAWRGILLRQSRGHATSAADMILAFAGSLGLVLFILIAVIITLVMTFFLSMGVEGLAGVAAMDGYEGVCAILLVLALLIRVGSFVAPIVVGAFLVRTRWPHPVQ